jgi:hypothetical protein
LQLDRQHVHAPSNRPRLHEAGFSAPSNVPRSRAAFVRCEMAAASASATADRMCRSKREASGN